MSKHKQTNGGRGQVRQMHGNETSISVIDKTTWSEKRGKSARDSIVLCDSHTGPLLRVDEDSTAATGN